MAIAPVLPPGLHGLARAAFHYTFPQLAYQRLTSEDWREEEIEMDLLPALVDPQREAVDVGANVGHYALRLSRLVRRVHAFEAHPRLAYVLRRCLPPNVLVRGEAVSDRIGTAVLTVPLFVRPVEGMASLSADANRFATARGLTRIRVPSTTLDELAEHDEVLKGAKQLILRQRPTFLVEVEERHRPGSVHTLFESFSAQDYRGFFACNAAILATEAFTVDMQNLHRIVAAAPRKSYDYVNNFIFQPRERWSASWELRLRELLESARVVNTRAITATRQ
jgi:FkbM family methyltransferase